ncbi:MAG: ornithine carbamoyltransferase [Deltaproteobacteria bacterium]|nr:MAG: ornithine carbamoyltransferase [Deltaproteobacteria bacterium]
MRGERKRDLLRLTDLTADELLGLLPRAAELKAARQRGQPVRTLAGRTLGMVFEKASTRTRVSFEIGMVELGGYAVYLTSQGTQIGRGEPIEDTARVLGRYCHGIVIRTFAQSRCDELARWSPVPVINGLTDLLHPCQVVADLFTVYELRDGDVAGARYAWIGDGNNMANSWIHAAGMLGLELRLACPEGFDPDPEVLADARARLADLGRGRIDIVREPAAAAAGADVLSTDVWASMGQEEEAERRRRAFRGFCIDEALLARAAPDALVLHCLPAHRGEEITHGVIEGPQSAVWRQAENRLHVQKAILELFLSAPPAG